MKAFMPTYQSDAGTAAVTPSHAARRSRAARIPTEYAVHIMLDGGHREEVRFKVWMIFASGMGKKSPLR